MGIAVSAYTSYQIYYRFTNRQNIKIIHVIILIPFDIESIYFI